MRIWAMMICVGFLTGCVWSSAEFSEIQRAPPVPKIKTVEYLIQHDREVLAWMAETTKKCHEFGCAK